MKYTKYIKLFESFINSQGELEEFEPYSNSTITKNGELDFKGKYDSSMIFKDNSEFEEWLNEGFENVDFDKISTIYDSLSEEHKKITIKKFLELFLLDEKQSNINIVLDAIEWFPKEFDSFLKENISYWWSFGNGVLEWNPILIKIIPPLYQDKIYNYIKEFGEYELDMSKDMFYSFDKRIQSKISKLDLFDII